MGFKEIPSSGAWSCYLYAQSIHDSSGATVFDDGYSNWCGVLGGTSCNGNWHCDRRFLMNEYTNQDIILEFSYGGYYPTPSTYPTDTHDVYIFNNATATNLTSGGPIVHADFDQHVCTGFF